MIRVLSVFGTRPEAIKMAPVVQALQNAPDHFESVVCVSAQHRAMLDQVLDVFGLVADHDLDLMVAGQSPAGITARVLERLPPLLQQIRPDVLLVQGDTMTSFAAAFAAFLEKIPSGHVEAGLRTGDRYQPFPEEMNRVLTARLASIHFAPTAQARAALLSEGIPAADVHLTGNTVIDALLQTVRPNYSFRTPGLASLDPARRLLLITTHRRESFGAPLESTCAAIRELARRHPDLQFVLPVHPNPQVKATVERLLCDLPGMHLIEPVDYVEFVQLMNRAYLVLTDSGGVQEEAPALGRPVLVMRETTERPEGVAAGTA
ncbi:MAG: non-hydrolyzing UDP-N-acetylglucosamine 2-epimerase, partial [Gemmatimonadales bacterium]